MNVREQVKNVCDMPAVRAAWKSGEQLAVHGFIYDIKDGNLHNLNVTVQQIPLD